MLSLQHDFPKLAHPERDFLKFSTFSTFFGLFSTRSIFYTIAYLRLYKSNYNSAG